MKRKIFWLAVGFLMILSLAAGSHAQTKTITMLTLPVGTVGYSLGLAAENIAKKHHPWLRIKAVATPGIAASTDMVINDKKRWSNTLSGIGIYEMYCMEHGLPPMKKLQSVDMRMASIYTQAAHWLVTFNPNIKTVNDLAGKKIGIGGRAQTLYGAQPTMFLEYMGMAKKIDIQYSGFGGAKTALLDGLVDAALVNASVGPPTPPAPGSTLVEILASGKPVYHISWGTPERVVEWNKKKFNGRMLCPSITIKAAEIKGMTQDVVALTGFYGWGGHKDLQDDLAYEFVKTHIKHAEKFKLYHAHGKFYAPQFFVPPLPEKWIFPGAVRAYKEAGVWNKKPH